MKKYLLIFIGVLTFSFTAKAQDGFENFLLLEQPDSKELLQAYFSPAMKGFIYSMNNGWYHTAKVHKKFGFDLTIGLSASIVPTKDEVFKLADLSLSNSITGNANYNGATEYATFTGSDNNNSLHFTKNIAGADRDLSFSLPNGATENLPLNAVSAPIVQLGLGLPFKTDVMLRIIPKVGFGSGNIDMLGIGIKKEITSWFGPLDKLPFLHVSLLAAYTTLNVEYGIEDSNTGDFRSSNAIASSKLKAFTTQAIASLNFPFINIYGGFGYSSGSSTLSMDGDFHHQFAPFETSPVAFTPLADGLDFKESGMKTTVGARLSLGFFKIFADYTLQEYNTVSAGIAISIR